MNVNIACDWLSHGGLPLRNSCSTVFSRVEISLPGLNRARKRTRKLVKKERLGTARVKQVTIKKTRPIITAIILVRSLQSSLCSNYNDRTVP